MKTILMLLFTIFTLAWVSEAATPKYITKSQCNQQIQKQIKQTKFLLWFAEAVTYDYLSYSVCLWEAIRYGTDTADCNSLYEWFKNSYNYGKWLWLFSKFGYINDYE